MGSGRWSTNFLSFARKSGFPNGSLKNGEHLKGREFLPFLINILSLSVRVSHGPAAHR